MGKSATIAHYKAGAPWTGHLACPSCGHSNPAWQSSGMSESRPHFYCDSCSNVLCRRSDHALLYEYAVTAELLARISQTLPACPCGGQFSVDAHPKCRKCSANIPNKASPVERLDNPHMLLIDGSTLVRDELDDYEICIGSRLKYWVRRARRALAARAARR